MIGSDSVGIVLDLSKLSGAYVSTELGIKLAQKGVSLAKLASLSETSRADVTNYVYGKHRKIGCKRRRRILAALCDMGIYLSETSVQREREIESHGENSSE